MTAPLLQDIQQRMEAAPRGVWDPTPEEIACVNTEPRGRFVVYLALGPGRSLAKLERLLKKSYPEMSVNLRQLELDSARHKWAARVKAWDIESSKGVLPVLWDRERAKITRITRADVQGAARIQALVMRDVKRLEDWEEVDERPSLVFPSQSMALVYRNAQQIMRTALGLDAREQLALGNMVPVKQRDSAVRFLEMALSELPDDKSAQLRLAWAREVEELEGE